MLLASLSRYSCRRKIANVYVGENSLSLDVSRKQIWAVEGLLATGVCAAVGSFWVVVQFMASAVLGTSKDLCGEEIESVDLTW